MCVSVYAHYLNAHLHLYSAHTRAAPPHAHTQHNMRRRVCCWCSHKVFFCAKLIQAPKPASNPFTRDACVCGFVVVVVVVSTCAVILCHSLSTSPAASWRHTPAHLCARMCAIYAILENLFFSARAVRKAATFCDVSIYARTTFNQHKNTTKPPVFYYSLERLQASTISDEKLCTLEC